MLAAAPGVAHAAQPPGAPVLRVARPADQVDHPAVYQERWTVRMLDPRTDAMVELRFVRSPQGSGLVVARRRPDGTQPGPAATVIDGRPTASARRLEVAGPQGRAAVTARTSGSTVAVATPDLGGSLTLDRVRPGPAALDARLGAGRAIPEIPRVWLSWAMPIARSRVRGTLAVGGETIRLDGWRATYEHWWGQLVLEERAYDLWDTWSVHRRDATWVAFGLNRPDIVTGPGANDAMWLGVLARAGARGTSVCRPRIHRTKWILGGRLGVPVVARRFDARCGRTRAVFRSDDRLRLFEPHFSWADAHGPATVDGRGDGWAVQRS